MTETKTIDIDTLSAGREMDALVAKQIFNVLEVIPYGTSEGDFFCHLGQTADGGGISEPLRHYSTSIAAAWEVWEWAKQEKERWVKFVWALPGAPSGIHSLCRELTPLAICRAALKAKE